MVWNAGSNRDNPGKTGLEPVTQSTPRGLGCRALSWCPKSPMYRVGGVLSVGGGSFLGSGHQVPMHC